MEEKQKLLASLIHEQKVLKEMAQAVANIAQSGGDNNLQQMAEVVANIGHRNIQTNDTATNQASIEGHEYVYWARRGSELDTAVEVEVSSTGTATESNGIQFPIRDPCAGIVDAAPQDQRPQTFTDISNSIVQTESLPDLGAMEDSPLLNTGSASQSSRSGSENIADCLQSPTDAECAREKRMEEKREMARVQEKLMNQEYQKAIGYLLCSSKSKSGKQKKKQTMTAYLFFCRRYRSKIVARNPKMSFAQISKVLSHMWRNASEQEKNTYRLKLEQHRSKVNAIVEKNMIEKMKLFKEKKLAEEICRRNEEIRNMKVASPSLQPQQQVETDS